MTERTKKFSWEKAGDRSMVVTIEGNGATVEFDFDKFPPEIQNELICYGLKQLPADRASSFTDPAELKAKLEGTRDDLISGKFRATREGGSRGVSQIVTALARMYKLEVPAVIKMWDAQDEATQAGIRKDPKVKAMVAQIKLENAKANAKAADKEETGAADALFAA